LQNERRRYGKEDPTIHSSLNAASEDFAVVVNSVKTVREPEAYKAAATTYHTKKLFVA